MKVNPLNIQYCGNEDFRPLLNYNEAQTEKILDIIKDFQKIKTDFFIYRTLYDNGELVFLCTDQDWLEKRFSPLCTKSVFRKQICEIPLNEFKIFSWAQGDNKDPVYNLLSSKNLSNGISLYRKKSNCLESFHFATKNELQDISKYFLSNLLIIERFIFYFNQKLYKIIDKNNSLLKLNNISYDYKDELFDEKKIKRIHIETPNGEAFLSYRECEVLYLLSRLMSYKEIARYLNISDRTVETNIENVKIKMGITSRSMLLKCLEANDVIKFFKR